MQITAAQLNAFAPGAKPALVAAVVEGWGAATEAGIDANPKRLSCFLANVANETGGFRVVDENLNYTTTAQLRKTWPTRFPTDASAKPFVRQPQKLAIKVYGGRMGNKPAPSTDGWDFRGGGMLQTTGRDGYAALGFEDHPEQLRDPHIAFDTAVREWSRRNMNKLADAGDLAAVRRAVNGGLIGFEQFKAYVTKALRVWPTTTGAPVRLEGGPAPAPTGATTTTTTVATAAPSVLLREGDKDTGDSHTIEDAETKLYALGYTECGTPDGDFGPMTATAVLAFEKDNGLPLSPVIDDPFLLALAKAKPRVLSADRTDASSKDVRQTVPEVKAAWWTKIGAMVLGIPAALGATFQGALQSLPDARGLLSPVEDILTTIPPWGWALVVFGVAVGIFVMARHSEKKGVEAFQTGARR